MLRLIRTNSCHTVTKVLQARTCAMQPHGRSVFEMAMGHKSSAFPNFARYGNDILVGSASRNLAARRNLAAFVDEFAPMPPEYVGRVIVSSTTGTASIIGLRFTGTNFTTIPATVPR